MYAIVFGGRFFFWLTLLILEGWRMCKHWKLFLHPYIGIMSAPPPYSPLPPVSTTSSSSSRVTSLMSSMGLGAERHTRSLGTDGFELWPLPPGARVTVEKAYEGKSTLSILRNEVHTALLPLKIGCLTSLWVPNFGGEKPILTGATSGTS